jgi:hypothetical protein
VATLPALSSATTSTEITTVASQAIRARSTTPTKRSAVQAVLKYVATCTTFTPSTCAAD